jgi:mono/diheme cytochrome c family protein/glucose/arabinose dehydrogenase
MGIDRLNSLRENLAGFGLLATGTFARIGCGRACGGAKFILMNGRARNVVIGACGAGRIALLMLALAGPSLWAQMGDTLGEGPQVPLPAVRKITPDPVYSPAEEQRTFQLPPGYKVELVAAEPLVHDPVAAAIDLEGNLWVAEFTTFNAGMVKDMPEMARGVTHVPSSRIVKLVSSRHDGHYDVRIDWLEGLAHLRGLAIVRDGVLVADPPNLWLAREAHGTGRCDEKILLVDNFGIPSTDEDAGSLLWGRDNVLHDISFVYDYLYRHGRIERLPVMIRGQFGISQDDWGRLFYSRNSDQLRCDLFAPRYGVRNPDATELPWANVNVAEDQVVWPSHPNPAVNRGYRRAVLGQQNGGLRDDGTLQEYTAACASMVYRGRNFPAGIYGNVFVPEPSANLIHLDLLAESRGRILARDAYSKKEFLTSTDTRFRPVGLLNAPDGSMLVLDMYRGVLEEYHIITSYLRQQSLARGLDQPMFGLGRIWRITYGGGPLERREPDLARLSSAELARVLANPNGWWRDAAQQALVERGGREAVPLLQELARHALEPATRVAALWTLDGLEATAPDLLGSALGDPSPKVRQAAVRLHERLLAGPDAAEALRALESVAADPAPEVVVQLALTLGECRGAAALPAMDRLLGRADCDPFVPAALATGLGGREAQFMRLLEADASAGAPTPARSSMYALLASSIVHRADPKEVGGLVASAGDDGGLPGWARQAVVAALGSALGREFRESMRAGSALTSAEVAPLAQSADAGVRSAAEAIVSKLREAEEETRLRNRARPLNGEELRLYEAGRITFQVCASCHQENGTGRPGVAPSLVDSHWVAADPGLAIRIVLNGKEGTLGFPGAMPPIGGSYSDEQIAGVVTYIRNSWGLHAGAVDPATVAKVRTEVGGRIAAWDDNHLGRIEYNLKELKAGHHP